LELATLCLACHFQNLQLCEPLNSKQMVRLVKKKSLTLVLEEIILEEIVYLSFHSWCFRYSL